MPPWFIILLNLLEISSCITGFIYFGKIRRTYWKWFPWYLAVISLTEIIAEYLLYARHNLKLSDDLYRFFGIPLEFIFLYWLFYMYFLKSKAAKWPVLSIITYVICFFADVFFVGKMRLFFDSFSYTVGNILLLVLLLVFFLKFIASEAILEYRSSMMFWVCVGMLIFYLGSLPFYGLRTSLYYRYPGLFYIYWYVQFGMNYLMYILFSLAFIWSKQK